MRFSEFNDPWNFSKLYEISKKLEYGIGASAVNFDGNHRYIRITDISNWGCNEITSPSFLDKAAILKDKDILLARTGATVGDSFIYKDDGIESYFAGFLIRAKIEKHNPYFIYYQLKTDRYHQWVKISSARSGQPGINSEQYGSYQLGITSSEEENKIASFLTTIEERISTQNKIIRNLESLYNGIKEKIIKCTTNHKSIDDFLEEVVTKTTVQDEFPVLSSTVKGLFLQTDYFKRNIASENNIGYKIVKKNQIIVSPQNLWMGNMTFNDKFENGIVSPSYKVYRIKEGYDADYIVSILTTKRAFYYYSQVSEQGASVVRRNLNIDAFEQLSFPVPSFEKQKEFSRLIRSIRNKLVCENNYLENLILQKEYLLENLFI